MSDQLDLPQTEALLRAHYARSAAGRLRPELAAQIAAGLDARANRRSSSTRLHLEPVRATLPAGRLPLGWSLAAAALVVVLVASWMAVGRLATPSTAASPTGAVSPVASASLSASASGQPVASASGGAVVPPPPGPLSRQRAIAFADRSHGLVVGEYQGQGAVWATADGGQTWTSALVATPPLDSVAVLGTRAWASAACVGVQACAPAVLTSDDRGATWKVIATMPVESLTFVDAAHGFGVSSASNSLLETTDGGRTWTQAPAPCEVGFVPAGVSFPDAQRGWVSCDSGGAAGSSSKEVLATRDGGATWTIRSRVRLVGAGQIGQLPLAGGWRGIQMLSSGSGVAWLFTSGQDGLIRTTDGGTTWTSLPGPPGSVDWPGAAITADGGLFALTRDAGGTSATFNLGFNDGRTWKPYGDFGRFPAPGTTPTPEPTSPPLPAIADAGVAFFDLVHGIAVGNDAARSYLWRTADGGKTWAVAPLGKPIARLKAVLGNTVWIIVTTCPPGTEPSDPACASALERSDDRGATWRVIGHQALGSISFGDPMRGFGVGASVQPSNGNSIGGSGTGVYRTMDGGATWRTVEAARPCGNLDPVSVSFVSATRGWLGCEGAGGAGEASKGVMETTDGGRSWMWRSRIYGPSGSPTNMGSISISDYLDTLSIQPDGGGFMTSVRGSTFRTTDGGRTWLNSPPGEFDLFNTSAASIVPGGPWFVIQSGSNIATDQPDTAARLMRSDNQGKTWTQVGPLMPSP